MRRRSKSGIPGARGMQNSKAYRDDYIDRDAHDERPDEKSIYASPFFSSIFKVAHAAFASNTERVICMNRKNQVITGRTLLDHKHSNRINNMTAALCVVWITIMGSSIGSLSFRFCAATTAVYSLIILKDFFEGPRRFKFTSISKKTSDRKHSTNSSASSLRESTASDVTLKRVSVRDCLVEVTSVRVVDRNTTLDPKAFARPLINQTVHPPPTKAYYEIRMVHKTQRWSSWKSYEDVESCMYAVTQREAEEDSMFKSVAGIQKEQCMSSSELRQQQVDMMHWLRKVQSNPDLCDDSAFRKLLSMPAYTDPKIDDGSELVSTVQEDGSVSTKKKNWKGRNYKEFEFTDESPRARDLYTDCSRTHNFKVRGSDYMTKKKKIEAGYSIAKLVMMEVYEVEPTENSDRHDHICSRGRVKQRIEAMGQLPDKPFVFVLNIQVPGDPPVSVVSYFLLPPDMKERMTQPDDQSFFTCLDRFLDVPRNEKERLAAWGIDIHEHEQGAEGAVRSDMMAAVAPLPQSSCTGDNRSYGSVDATDANDGIRGSKSRSLSSNGGIFSSTDHFEDRDTAGDQAELGASTVNDCNQGLSKDANRCRLGTAHADERGRSESMMREVASLADIPSDTDKKSIDPKMKSDGGGSDGSSINMMNGRDEPGNPSNGTMCSPGGSDAVGLSKQQIAAAVAAARPPGGWYKGTGMSDITWQEPTAEGVLPLSDYRNKRFKLIPSIVEGPWVVKMAVGSTPVCMGQKLVQRYFSGENYLEIDAHVGSSVIATKIVGLCRGYAKQFICNLGVVIQGESEEELPERMFCTLSMNKLDLDIRRKLDFDPDEEGAI